MSETTKDLALNVSLSIQNNDWDRLDSLLSPDFTYKGDGLSFNKDEYIGFMQGMTSAFSNMKMQFNHVLVSGDYVTINFTSYAQNTGSFMGGPATKKPVIVNGTLIREIKNGVAIAEWQTTDLLGLMTQMGFGALFGYAVAVGLFKLKPKKPKRHKIKTRK